MTAGAEVAAWGGAVRRTRVVRAGDGYLWCLSWPAGTRPRVDAAPVPRPIVTPSVTGSELVYPTWGAEPLATWLAEGRDTALPTGRHVLHTVLPAVAGLHTTPASRPTMPAPLLRLRSYLTRSPHLLAATGETLMAWVDRLGSPATPVRVHGGLSMGVLVPGEAGWPSVALAEPTAGSGAPELDPGWLVGELLERRALPTRRDDGPLARALQREVASAFGDRWRLPEVAMAATLRIALHLHDFATHVGGGTHLRAVAELVRRLVDAVTAGDDRRLAAYVTGGRP